MEPIVDSNNNASGGKYSLRPRTAPRRVPGSPESVEEAKPRRRSRTSSHRTLPLSKYRRKSANARERSRMREINEAFAALRRVVGWGDEGGGEKVTKISTLRLAMRHITALSDALRDSGTAGTESSTLAKDIRCQGQSASYCPPLSVNHSSVEYLVTLNSSLKVPETSVRKFDEKPSHMQRPSSTVQNYCHKAFTSSLVADILTSESSVRQEPVKSTRSDFSKKDCCNINCVITNRSQRPQKLVDIKASLDCHLASTGSHAEFFSPNQSLQSSCTHGTSRPESCSHLPQPEDCSPLLSSVIDDLPLQPISFEELFIT